MSVVEMIGKVGRAVKVGRDWIAENRLETKWKVNDNGIVIGRVCNGGLVEMSGLKWVYWNEWIKMSGLNEWIEISGLG